MTSSCLFIIEEEDGDTDSYMSTIGDDDTHSMISSVYDRETEQRLVVVEENNFINTQVKNELKSENILDSIQVR